VVEKPEVMGEMHHRLSTRTAAALKIGCFGTGRSVPDRERGPRLAPPVRRPGTPGLRDALRHHVARLPGRRPRKPRSGLPAVSRTKPRASPEWLDAGQRPSSATSALAGRPASWRPPWPGPIEDSSTAARANPEPSWIAGAGCHRGRTLAADPRQRRRKARGRFGGWGQRPKIVRKRPCSRPRAGPRCRGCFSCPPRSAGPSSGRGVRLV
jgi:hypothetical protein